MALKLSDVALDMLVDAVNNDHYWWNWDPRLTNWTPTSSSRTPTINEPYVGYWNRMNWYRWNKMIYENWKVVYNPGNWNWGYDNLRWVNQNNNITYQPFSTSDTLNQRAQGYQAQWLEWLANSYRTLNKENNAYNNTANRIASYYEQLANDINSRENALAQQKESLANRLSQDIANQRQYVMDYFGPNWIFTNAVNQFYDENGNYLASEAGRQMAMANAEGIQSWASLWAQRAARNEAYNNAFQNYLKVREQELSAKMNIQQQLINYMNALRQEYWDTQNTYIISQYQRANDLLNAISTNLTDSQNQIELARLQQALSSGSRDMLLETVRRLESWNYEKDADWNLTANWRAQQAVDMRTIRLAWWQTTQNSNDWYTVNFNNALDVMTRLSNTNNNTNNNNTNNSNEQTNTNTPVDIKFNLVWSWN